MQTYALTAYGGTGLGYGKGVGTSFTADTSLSADIVVQDDDAILNDWSAGNYHGTVTPGIMDGDTTSTVISSAISWLPPGEMITSGVWWEMSYTDPVTGSAETLDVFLLWNDTNNYWGGFPDSFIVTTKPLIDGVTYTATTYSNNAGVPWAALACFAQGTRIATPDGPRAIETLTPGDRVLTRDAGAQILRWVGARTVPATRNFAPIRIAQGMLGAERPLRVSPCHRMLLTGAWAEVLFDTPEVLVAAKHLIDGDRITRRPGGTVTYWHLLFDSHQIIFAEGCPSESFHPGPGVLGAMAQATRREVLALFPELATPAGLPPTARRVLTRPEARALRACTAR